MADKGYLEAEEEWRARKRAAKNKKEQPEDPKYPVRYLTLNNTVALSLIHISRRYPGSRWPSGPSACVSSAASCRRDWRDFQGWRDFRPG